MSTCATCRWWGVAYAGVCDRVECLGSLAEIEASADDDSGLTARLVTKPEFGCVMHDPKPESEDK